MTEPRVLPHDFDVVPGESLEVSQAVYADLRQRCPVAHTDALGGFWALTKHADIARAAADYSVFSTTVQNVVPKVASTGRRPPLHLDPPAQTPYRAALNPLLSAERVAVLEPVIRADPARGKAWLALGDARWELKDKKGAREANDAGADQALAGGLDIGTGGSLAEIVTDGETKSEGQIAAGERQGLLTAGERQGLLTYLGRRGHPQVGQRKSK